MIILTDDQADLVRGLTRKGSAIAPRPMADGNWALPEGVLNDITQERFKNFLASLPTVRDNTIRNGTPVNPDDPLSPIIDSDWSQDTTLVRETTPDQTWQEGQIVRRQR